MLLFILALRLVLAASPLIQIHLMLLFIEAEKAKIESSGNSNTSHVIVYQERAALRHPDPFIQIHLMLLFIILQNSRDRHEINSNTSHVIVYLDIQKSLACSLNNSNTSHVIVYPALYIFQSYRYNIQIHLMLLFILPPR